MFLSVFVDAPFVRTFVWAYVTAEFRFCIHALELPMPPERSFHRVTLATICAHVSPLARFVDGTSSLLMLHLTNVVSVHPLVRPHRWNTNVKSVKKSNYLATTGASARELNINSERNWYHHRRYQYFNFFINNVAGNSRKNLSILQILLRQFNKNY